MALQGLMTPHGALHLKTFAALRGFMYDALQSRITPHKALYGSVLPHYASLCLIRIYSELESDTMPY